MLNTSVNIAFWQILAKTNLTQITTVYTLTSYMLSLWLDSFLSTSMCYFSQCLPVVCFLKSFGFFDILLFLIHPIGPHFWYPYLVAELEKHSGIRRTGGAGRPSVFYYGCEESCSFSMGGLKYSGLVIEFHGFKFSDQNTRYNFIQKINLKYFIYS